MTGTVQVEDLGLGGVKRITPVRHADERGYFSETYNKRTYASAGIDLTFVQDNHTLSRRAGVVRGLHYQLPPHGQYRLVRVLAGRIFDVAVDLRADAPSFGRHVAVTLDAADGAQLLVPPWCGHGTMTLEPETEVFYKVTAHYAPDHERGVRWDDPALGIAWPAPPDGDVVLSAKDRALPALADLAAPYPA